MKFMPLSADSRICQSVDSICRTHEVSNIEDRFMGQQAADTHEKNNLVTIPSLRTK